MTRRRPQQRDPLAAAIEAALQPGRSIARRAGWDFVSSLEEVAAKIEKLIRIGSERAVAGWNCVAQPPYRRSKVDVPAMLVSAGRSACPTQWAVGVAAARRRRDHMRRATA